MKYTRPTANEINTAHNILVLVSDHFHVEEQRILSGRYRVRVVANARGMFYLLAYEFANMSWGELGRQFSRCKDHSTPCVAARRTLARINNKTPMRYGYGTKAADEVYKELVVATKAVARKRATA